MSVAAWVVGLALAGLPLLGGKPNTKLENPILS
ncbi:MAG: hypothetical protein H6Q89_4732, partial [Myxococcaceae bacterium]|nr:hypothetical protein [Myxococcaceae bacterium]